MAASKSASQMSAMELMDMHSKAQQAEIERLRGRALDLEALALCVLSVEENCANAERYPNGCGECIYCQSAALMLTQLPAETAPVELCGDTVTLNNVPWRCIRPKDHRDHERRAFPSETGVKP